MARSRRTPAKVDPSAAAPANGRADPGLHLQWEGRRVYKSRIPTPRVLEPDRRLSRGDSGENLVVEGDNLQVMVSLRSQYTGAVDVCYIDPPYNRGGNDFRYSDARFHDPNADGGDAEYVSNEDGGRHTKWLNFMAPRLAMIWELLADHGILLVSINDIELFRLGMLLDEIFDERNRIGVICWKGAADNNPTRLAVEHEYILCYAKRLSEVPQIWTSPNDELRDTLLDEFKRLRKGVRSVDEVKRRWAALYKEHKGSIRATAADAERQRDLHEARRS